MIIKKDLTEFWKIPKVDLEGVLKGFAYIESFVNPSQILDMGP